MSSASASSAGILSSLLSSRPLSIPRPSSFSIQHDWEAVLREYTQAKTKNGTTAGLPKESREFWFTWERQENARQEEKRLDAQVKLEERPSNDAAASGSGIGTSLTAAAKAVLPNAGMSDLDLQFLGPLQLLAHHTPSHTTQLIQAPRSTLNELHPYGDIFTVDVNPQGQQAISGGLNGTLRTFDAATGTLTKDLKGHAGDVHLARFFPSGSVAISAGLDLGMKIWAVDSGACVTTLKGHSRPVTSISFLERGRNLVTSSEDGTACLWDVSKQAVIATYPRQHKDPFAPKWNDAVVIDPTAHPWELSKEGELPSSTTGHLLLTGGSDGILRGFDLRAQGQVLMVPGIAGGVDCLMAGPKQHTVTLGSGEGVISMLELRKQQPLHTFSQSTASITNLRAWGDDSFWSTSNTGEALLWRLNGATEAGAEPSAMAQLSGVDCEPIHDLCINPTTSFAYMASYNAVRVFALGALPGKAATEGFHGLELPQRKAVATPASASTTAAAPAEATK